MTVSKLSIREANGIVVSCLQRNGCSVEAAKSVAQVIIRAEADGCTSHGLFRVPGYVASLRSGKVNGAAEPKIDKTAPAVLTVDAAGGFSPPAMDLARPKLIELASATGIAALSVVNVYHFSALWTDIEGICEAGLSAMAFTCYLPFVAPAGGSRPVYGTNPMAFGWPRGNGRPMIFDQASSVMARGDVMLAAREGQDVRPGVGIDTGGNPTTNPNEILDGAMLTFGGYKGSSIAMMVELLAGALVGEPFSFEAGKADNADGGPPRGGELVLAIAPERFTQTDPFQHAEGLFSEITENSGGRLPADRRYVNRAESMAEGLTVPQQVLDTIAAL